MAVKGAAVLVTFVMTKIYIDTNGAEEYGSYISLHVYLLLIGAVAGSGFGIYGLKEFVRVDSFDHSIFKVLFALVIFSILALSPIIYAIKIWLEIKISYALICMGQYAISSFLVEILRYQLGGNSYLIIKDIARSAFVCFLLLLYPGMNYDALILLSASLHLCTVLMLTLYVLRVVRVSSVRPKKINIISTFRQCMTVSVANGFQTVKAWVDLYAATLLLQPSGVAIYSVCQKLGQLVKLPLVALNADIAKGVARAVVNNDYPSGLKLRVNITRVLGVLFSVLAVLGLPVFLKFYEFEVNEGTLIFSSIIIAANLINVLSGPVGLFAQMSNIRGHYLLANILAVLVSLSAAYIFVPIGGVIALSMIAFVVAIFWNAFIYMSIYKKYRIKV